MDDLTDQTLMGLPEFRKLLHLSPSGERRMRNEQQDWPPSTTLGRRVFYFRDGVRDFLARRLAVSVAVHPEAGESAGAGDHAVQATAVAAEQRRWSTEVSGRLSGDADDPFRPVDLDAAWNEGEQS